MNRYISPVKSRKITSPFGQKRANGIIHNGVDYVSLINDLNIYCTIDGIVRIAANGYNGGAGNYVEVYGKDGFYHRYLHLDKIFVKQNQEVKQGQIIGIMGNTGLSFGIHLHYDVRKFKQLDWTVNGVNNYLNFESLLK